MKNFKNIKSLKLLHFARGQSKPFVNTAFTMAEILISLTIIGIIAAITLPALQSNINDKVWKTQRKALHSRLSQAIALMPSMNGYGNYSGTWEDDVVTVENDTAAMAFVTDGLSKVLKISNVCDEEHLNDCGISSSITNMADNKINFPQKLSDLNRYFTSTYVNPYWNFSNSQHNIDTKVAAFETQNDESVAVFYNPFCISKDVSSIVANGENEYNNNAQVKIMFPWMCANFVYDLNGTKGPNTVGKDIGIITALYATDTVVAAPSPAKRNAPNPSNNATWVTQDLASQACLKQNADSRVPTIEEAIAIQCSANLYNLPTVIWTSKKHEKYPTLAYFVSSSGSVRAEGVGQQYSVRCLER